MKKSNWKILVLLHLLIMLYSFCGVFSKLASQQQFLSFKFCLYYGIIISLLGIYAIGWQQIIKRLLLTTAFANKSITVVWGMIWGRLFFDEKITLGKVVGIIFVIIGIVLFATEGSFDNNEE